MKIVKYRCFQLINVLMHMLRLAGYLVFGLGFHGVQNLSVLLHCWFQTLKVRLMLPLSRKRVDRDSLQITASSPSTDAKWDKELSAYNRSKRTENKPKSNVCLMLIRLVKVTIEQIKDLEEQLEELRLDHERLKFTHGQLLASLDSDMDRRRVSLLKLQNIQLERQIVALNEQLERRHHGWMLMENLLSRLEDSKGNEDLAEIKNVMRHIDGNHRLLERELSIPFEFMGLFSSQRRIDFRQLCSGMCQFPVIVEF